jgi:hypothetical protein
MYDTEDTTDYKTCNMMVTKTPGATSTHGVNIGLPATTTSIQPVKSSNVAFDTRATGSIVMNNAILANVSNCRATKYKGLNGSLMVSKVGQLGDIEVAHYGPRAKLSILSASDCWHLGHQWEFKVGDHIDNDAFLLHTGESTYIFKHKEGLYICDMETKPEPRHIGAPTSRFASTNVATVCKQQAAMLFGTKLPTQPLTNRSTRNKFVAALNAGSFLNCTVIAADVRQATSIWVRKLLYSKAGPQGRSLCHLHRNL